MRYTVLLISFLVIAVSGAVASLLSGKVANAREGKVYILEPYGEVNYQYGMSLSEMIGKIKNGL